MGCDAPCKSGKYVILCPRCNGTRTQSDGNVCQETDCQDTTRWRGYKIMRRCPGSHQDADLSRALTAWIMLKRYNTWPVLGGSQDQAAGFLSFVSEIERSLEDAKQEH